MKNLTSIILLIIFCSPNFIFSQTSADSVKTFTFIGVGDIMMGTDYPDSSLPPANGKYLMSSLKNVLSDADITFGNLEGVLLDGGEPEKICKDTSICYIFRTPSDFVDNLVYAGFNLMSMANNHSFDFGIAGYKNSENLLKSNNINSAGRKGSFSVMNVNDIIVGFKAFAPNKGCTSINELEKVADEIKKLDQQCDVIIVSFHGGAEGNDALHVKNEAEVFYGEERGNVVEFARTAIDAGADIVVGHGPHVPRAVDLYKNKFIAYSLGNFCNYKKFNLKNERGYAPILKLKVNENGDFMEGKVISAIQRYPGGPELDNKKRAQKLIENLTKSDFPETQLKFYPDGEIVKID